VNQVDEVDPVQVVHLGKRVASGDCILASAPLLEQPEFDSPHGCLHAVANPQLGADVPYVPLYGARADREGAGYLLVRPSPHYQP
jgi:hypothetical protein